MTTICADENRVTARLTATSGLRVGEVAAVRALANAVRAADGVDLKWNREQFAESSGDGARDFCCFQRGRLVGYAQIDIGGLELEVTAAVLPEFRRRGIFRRLLEAVGVEARRRNSRR